MPTRVNSNADFYRQNEADLLSNGKDDSTSGNAGRTPVLDIEGGLSTTTVAVDGDLQSIDTAAEARSADPTANTAGAASARYSRSLLLRWLIKLLQLVEAKLPTLVSNRIPVDGSGVTQPVSGTVTANAGTGTFQVGDNNSSLTVDAPLTAPVAVRLSDGTAAIAPATAANQTTGNTSLASIDGKLPALVNSRLPVATVTASAVVSGRTTVTTAGTAVQFASNSLARSVIVTALLTNTDNVFIGPAGVTSSTGYVLSRGESVELAVSNTNALYLNSVVNGEGVSFIGL